MRSFSLLLLLVVFISCGRNLHQARIILLPDTQTYASTYPEVLDSQLSWIAREKSNISMVIQQGDLTDHNTEMEWQRVKAAFSKLDNQLPYVLAVGNHDLGSGPRKNADVRNADMFNQYFPMAHMSTLPAFGNVYEQGKMENAYYFFNTGKVKWMVLSLEFGPRDIVLDWANNVVAQHHDKVVILNTHAYLYSDSTRMSGTDKWRPQVYGLGKDTGVNAVNDGEQIWQKLVKRHPNIRFVFSGHVLNSGVGTLVSINDAGYPVYQMLANYQGGVIGSVRGGNGYLRILGVDVKRKTLDVKTWSPFIKTNHPDSAHTFSIKEVVYHPGK